MDDVKSSCPLCSGLHTCYNGRYNEQPTRESEQISKSRSQFGLHSATRVHEVGIASKRRSARCVEYVPGSCTFPGLVHTARHTMEVDHARSTCANRKEAAS